MIKYLWAETCCWWYCLTTGYTAYRVAYFVSTVHDGPKRVKLAACTGSIKNETFKVLKIFWEKEQ